MTITKKRGKEMIALGSDHGGFDLKCEIMEHLKERGLEYKDYGCFDKSSCDYPDFAKQAAKAVAEGSCERGILVCTTGIGISIAANKVKGIRAAAVSEPYSARLTRMHNDANVLCMGARVVGTELAKMILDEYLGATFEGGRHAGRVELISKIESGEM